MGDAFLTQEPWMIFFDLLLIIGLYYLLKPASNHKTISKTRSVIIELGILLFCLFSFWGTDWFHYQELYFRIRNDVYAATSLEPVYEWIITNISFSYLFFRLLVWGIALLLLNDTLRRLPIEKKLAKFIFVSIALIWFSYARVSLAMALLFWGLTVFVQSGRRSVFLSSILALGAIGVSYFFHKSALFGIGIVVLSILSSKMNKRFYFLLLLAIPLLAYMTQHLLVDFMKMEADSEGTGFDQFIITGQNYLGQDITTIGIGSLLQQLLERLPYYLTAVVCIRLQTKREYSSTPRCLKAFVNATLLIVVLASFFLINSGQNTQVVYVRFLRFCFIPVTIVLAYCWERGYFPVLTRVAVFCGWAGSLYSVLYSFYVSIIA